MKFKILRANKNSYGALRNRKKIEYIVIHYTGNNGDTAQANAEYFKHTNTRQAGAHWFVDQKGHIYRSVPMTRIAWAVGGLFSQSGGAGKYYLKCMNSNSVSIELCDNLTKDPSPVQIARTRELVSYIQSKCPNAKTIIRHWDVNGKHCPARMVGKDNELWREFRRKIS